MVEIAIEICLDVKTVRAFRSSSSAMEKSTVPSIRLMNLTAVS